MKLKHLDLFSGIGGFALACKWTEQIETVQFVEINPFCRSVLVKNFPEIPICERIEEFSSNQDYDIVTAGFPCQDLSVAGKQRGIKSSTRSSLFFEIIRIVRETRPRYLVLENVAALLSSNQGRDMGAVLWELSQIGYDAEWAVIAAAELGANHVRERLWIVAYPNSLGQSIQKWRERGEISKRWILPTNKKRKIMCSGYQRNELSQSPRLSDISGIPRTNDGLSDRMDSDRIAALGNAVVPQVAQIPIQRILDIEKVFRRL